MKSIPTTGLNSMTPPAPMATTRTEQWLAATHIDSAPNVDSMILSSFRLTGIAVDGTFTHPPPPAGADHGAVSVRSRWTLVVVPPKAEGKAYATPTVAKAPASNAATATPARLMNFFMGCAPWIVGARLLPASK
jgi:hypothetical protein